MSLHQRVPSNYKVVYDDHYVLPFLRQQVKKDFDIEIEESTHAKLIIKKNDSVNGSTPDSRLDYGKLRQASFHSTRR